MKKILILLGPTGSGKTELAVDLARRLNGEIINADSRQVYQELNIGVAAPSEQDFQSVPHHLYQFLSLNEKMSTARFRHQALIAIEEIHSRKRLPILVGGTGLYIKTLLFGICDEAPSDMNLRQQLKEKGLTALYKELKEKDPDSAKKIHPNDEFRIIRALEVYTLTGKTLSARHAEHGFKKTSFDYIKMGVDISRAVLYDRINQRVDLMVEQGLESEVKNLVEKYGKSDLLQKIIGYGEWFDYFDGKINQQAVTDQIKQKSRNYAKRQLTWFRKEKDIRWMSPDEIKGFIWTSDKGGGG